jgi:hypothetical protein
LAVAAASHHRFASTGTLRTEAGAAAARVGHKTFIPTREIELKGAFDEWLARVVCFAFSISPQAFSEAMNRATAETAPP